MTVCVTWAGGRMKDDSWPAGALRGEDIGQRRGRRTGR